MHDPNRWPGSPDTSIHIMLGRLDAKADHQTSILQALVRSNDQALIALQRSTQHPSPISGPSPHPSAPSSTAHGETSDEGVIMMIVRHLAPKAILWAAGRLFGIVLQFALPTLLLMWAMGTKWAWSAWSLLLAWLGLGH